jgi:hypothetical protein
MDLRVDGAFRFSGSGGLHHAVNCVIGITLRRKIGYPGKAFCLTLACRPDAPSQARLRRFCSKPARVVQVIENNSPIFQGFYSAAAAQNLTPSFIEKLADR